MFTKKELTWIIIAIIILTFVIGISANIQEKTAEVSLIVPLISSTLIILTTTITKKLVSPIFNIEIEHKIWEFKRYGIYKRAYLKKPFPIGLILPVSLSLISLGFIKFMALLQFDFKNIPSKRILKQRGYARSVRKEEINDSDIGLTAAWGFYSLFLLAIISSILGISTNIAIFPELAKYSIYYGLWNLIPFGQLDGSKLFFGSVFNWIVITLLYLLSLGTLIIL